MNLEQFAKKAGVRIVTCSRELHYQDGSNTTVGPFRTEAAAYKHWLVSEFTPQIAKAILRLLRETEAKK